MNRIYIPHSNFLKDLTDTDAARQDVMYGEVVWEYGKEVNIFLQRS